MHKMSSKTMVVTAVLFVTLCLTSFTHSYPQKISSPTADLKNDTSSKGNYCIAEEVYGQINLLFVLNDGQISKGRFLMKEDGDDFGEIIRKTYNESDYEDVYLVNSLKTTGKNGFVFNYYKLVTLSNVSTSEMTILQNENECIVMKKDGRIELLFNMDKSLYIGGMLVLKEIGVDIGQVVREVQLVTMDEGVFIMNTLFMTGKNGFKFDYYNRYTKLTN